MVRPHGGTTLAGLVRSTIAATTAALSTQHERTRRSPKSRRFAAATATYETDVTARKPRSENARGLTTVGEAWDYMEQVHHAYVHDLYISSVRTSDP